MKIGFIGAGKVGFSLGKYLVINNKEVLGYYSRGSESARLASVFTGTKHYQTLEGLVEECDTIFITTSDDEIPKVLSILNELNIAGKILCHTSGSLSSEVFGSFSNSQVFGYSVHPMSPISDKYNSYKNLKNTFFTIEGTVDRLQEVHYLINSMGNRVKIIDSKIKPLYHAASVTSSNFYLAIISRSIEYLKICGFSESEAIEALYPLCFGTLENIKELGIKASLTGPIERGDVSTLEKHIKALNAEDKSLYYELSNILLQIAKNKNSTRDYSKIEEFLGDREYEK